MTFSVLSAGFCLPANAQSAAQSAQRERMTTCNNEAKAKSLAGDQRKTFMSNCLAGKTDATEQKALSAPQQRMKDCNADATKQALTGEKRKAFLSTCLKG
ncbi:MULTISPECIES: PsiF family protein [unclassified Chelatococcus]|uniref:PsiF family protein n=1 Tax=unclassified Chelatococcus TaxID=2638111 RepID=UPI001BCD9BA3|nr:MULTISPECIES: PsiF family protein [unclassified Chelatococcus]MBS7696297.1 phosphate-starvation-inducible protein PsiF [Chelatococcus sp. YT9]MBX3556906.1 phosphate-starvation-inducible protein PsiF [Chelatococcus sp.]